jgi:hypothetical protein
MLVLSGCEYTANCCPNEFGLERIARGMVGTCEKIKVQAGHFFEET